MSDFTMHGKQLAAAARDNSSAAVLRNYEHAGACP